ncbi:MAG: hypothetical protein ICV73_01285 [Acetobacteraceae bacterium]|nr:hypothetical protein [Acetobacteraceae bacterium]
MPPTAPTASSPATSWFGTGKRPVNSLSTGGGWTSGAFQQGWNGQLHGRFGMRAKFDPGQGLSGTDQPFGWGDEWRGDYNGQASVARIDLGSGDDTATLLAGSAVVNGGAGADTAAFDGPASRYAVTALADGSTRVVDNAGVLGLTVLWGVERLRFADAEVAAPGQAALNSVLDLNPIG